MRETLIAALAGVVLFVCFHLAILGIGGELALPGWDLTRVFWADLESMRHLLAEGVLPLWNPYDRGGYPFAAEPQSRVFDPLTWVFVAAALMLGSTPIWLTTVQTAVFYGIASSGFAAWLRGHGLPRWAQAVGTAAFLLCGRMDKLKDQSGLWPAAWSAWFLFALERCIDEPDARRGVGLGAAGAMLVVSGYPPMAFRMALFAGPLALVFLVARVRGIEQREARRDYFMGLLRAGASAAVVAAGICAAQIVATIQVLSTTTRSKLGQGHVLASQLHLEHGLGFFAPYDDKGSLLVYSGALGLGLAGVALLRTRGRDRVLMVLLVLTVAAGFLLALGENGPLLPLVAELPGFRSFRIAGHYLLLSSIGLGALMGHGCAQLDGLARGEGARGERVLASVILVLAAVAWAGYGSSRGAVVWIGGGLAFACAGVLVWAQSLWLEGVRAHVPRGLLLAGMLAEIYVAGRPIANVLQKPQDPLHARELAGVIEDPQSLRVADYRIHAKRPGPHTGTRDLIGHRPALTDPHYLYVYKLAGRYSIVLQTMNVGAVALPARHRLRRSSRLQRVKGLEGRIYRVKNPWPRAFWVDSLRWVDDRDAMVKRLKRASTPRAIVEREEVPVGMVELLDGLPKRPAKAAGGDVVEDVELYARSGLLTAEADAPAAGLVVFNEAPAPGWQASVDGEDAEIVRVNLLHQAVWVPAGAHTVRLRYWPRYTGLLWSWWALTWLGLTGYAIVCWRRRRAEQG